MHVDVDAKRVSKIRCGAQRAPDHAAVELDFLLLTAHPFGKRGLAL